MRASTSTGVVFPSGILRARSVPNGREARHAGSGSALSIIPRRLLVILIVVDVKEIDDASIGA